MNVITMNKSNRTEKHINRNNSVYSMYVLVYGMSSMCF